jgi:hypothetical protein
MWAVQNISDHFPHMMCVADMAMLVLVKPTLNTSPYDVCGIFMSYVVWPYMALPLAVLLRQFDGILGAHLGKYSFIIVACPSA